MGSKEQAAKRKREPDEHCILCGLPCDEDRSNTTPEAWANLRSLALQWHGLDRFGTVYETVNWDGGSKNVFFHQVSKITLFSKCHVHLAKTRRDKAAAAKEILVEEQSSLVLHQLRLRFHVSYHAQVALFTTKICVHGA